MTTRRSFLAGLVGALAAPAVVRAESLMRVAAPQLLVPDALAAASGQLWYWQQVVGSWIETRGLYRFEYEIPSIPERTSGEVRFDTMKKIGLYSGVTPYPMP